MARTRKNRRNQKKTGGLAPLFENNTPVSLSYNGTDVNCDVCSSNNYLTIQSSIDKSKLRTVVRDMFFGENSGELDNTSVIMYVCNICGNCRITRNIQPLQIIAQATAAIPPTTTTTTPPPIAATPPAATTGTIKSFLNM